MPRPGKLNSWTSAVEKQQNIRRGVSLEWRTNQRCGSKWLFHLSPGSQIDDSVRIVKL
jgi:hypothetical protein